MLQNVLYLASEMKGGNKKESRRSTIMFGLRPYYFICREAFSDVAFPKYNTESRTGELILHKGGDSHYSICLWHAIPTHHDHPSRLHRTDIAIRHCR